LKIDTAAGYIGPPRFFVSSAKGIRAAQCGAATSGAVPAAQRARASHLPTKGFPMAPNDPLAKELNMRTDEWLNAVHPAYLQAHLADVPVASRVERYRVNRRNGYLFAAAVCRRLAPLVMAHAHLEGRYHLLDFLELAERYASSMQPRGPWPADRQRCSDAAYQLQGVAEAAYRARAIGYGHAASALVSVLHARDETAAALDMWHSGTSNYAAWAIGVHAAHQAGAGWAAHANEEAAELSFPAYFAPERAAQAVLFRDITGNPMQPVTVARSWRTVAVQRLAAAIDAHGDYNRLPELAEALAAAGCRNAAILDHCRGPGPHVRGCWVVDALSGRQ
jgi:hypothetical protein